jgi:membrane-bound metal-dependent hydrolase YbcI (DUF457 family)
MLGRTHALSGLAACSAIAMTAWHAGPRSAAVSAVITAGAAVLPDLDAPGSAAARSLGFLTRWTARAVAAVSGGHRHGTHSLAGVVVFAGAAAACATWRRTIPGEIALTVLLAVLLAAALRVLRLDGHAGDLAAVAAAVMITRTGYGTGGLWLLTALGTAVHIAGDMLTRSGCPLAWPVTGRRFWLLPAPARFTTGQRAERLIVTPLLLLALAAMAALSARGIHWPRHGIIPLQHIRWPRWDLPRMGRGR